MRRGAAPSRGPAARTSPAPLQWASRMVLWREWHELPVQYSELDPCAILVRDPAHGGRRER